MIKCVEIISLIYSFATHTARLNPQLLFKNTFIKYQIKPYLCGVNKALLYFNSTNSFYGAPYSANRFFQSFKLIFRND
ncbi:hypothetical protein DJ568_13080 [Mucilaginibacter hurinus]|uniref:Uncharacterized protein n=1 Tax=Mucilaginibacter hurinus TaxID=2201324 RepID=A0A367GL74_9SPHI|nr:hypothetical protein DJ568_13080 [Mucilaginibacter hurinus]